jgi:ribonucleoside-triphosphate reductase
MKSLFLCKGKKMNEWDDFVINPDGVWDSIQTPWSTIGYLTYKRTYSRKLLDDGDIDCPTEEFEDTIERVIEACEDQLECGFTEEEENRLRYYCGMLKGSVAGRFWWQLGTQTVERLGLASLQSCSFVVVDKPIRPFCWAMDMLALGSGVGYNIQKKHVDKLPVVRDWFKAPQRVDHGGADFIIPDSREGWVKFLGKTLKAAFLSEKVENGTFTYSTQVIRGKGSPIKGFGGVASGPDDLCWGINKISEILERRKGKKIRPVDALDIMNIIGHIIVAGNVRRSAQIAIGDPDDVEFLLAKRWDLGNIPSWRAMSNNSVACDDLEDLHEYFWDGYLGKGEPYGLINLRLSRECGRLGETQYPDYLIEGFNPCAEQSLESFETCCLAEIFLPNIESKNELFDVAELLYRICKHSLALKSHHPETQEVVHRNMRMGIGVTGVLQASEDQNGWLSECYEYLRDFDERYSEMNGFPVSIKLTTVKPSGTLSLLPGVTPGVHPGYAQYMYRRIRIATDHPLVEVCKRHGYPAEFAKNFDGTDNYGTTVITFPFAYPEGTKLAKDMTAIDQLKEIRRLQKDWSDNSVSCTVYYKKEELPEIRRYLEKFYRNNYKSLSFLLHSDHGFAQAPYEEVTKEEYEELLNKTIPINRIESVDFDLNDECAGGMCPIK